MDHPFLASSSPQVRMYMNQYILISRLSISISMTREVVITSPSEAQSNFAILAMLVINNHKS